MRDKKKRVNKNTSGTRTYEGRITINPKVLVGKPIIRGTRISVEFVLELLGNGWTHEQILENYPQLKKQDIVAAIQYAARNLREERVYLLR